MRIWSEWTQGERDLFTRIVQEDRSKLQPSELAEIAGYKLEMFLRPLSEQEVARVNYVLDGPERQARPVGSTNAPGK